MPREGGKVNLEFAFLMPAVPCAQDRALCPTCPISWGELSLLEQCRASDGNRTILPK